jgi:hypothetical protein
MSEYSLFEVNHFIENLRIKECIMENKVDLKQQDKIDDNKILESRRKFLKNSKYAMYATPLVTGLIVSSNAARASGANPIP